MISRLNRAAFLPLMLTVVVCFCTEPVSAQKAKTHPSVSKRPALKTPTLSPAAWAASVRPPPSRVHTPSPNVPLTLPEAVRRAETFIAENGYTEAAPTADLAKIELEWVDRYRWNLKPDGSWDMNRILTKRKGDLEPAACGWGRGGRFGPEAWQIVFRYRRNDSEPNRGRAVWMSGNGDEMHMVHEDARPKKFLPLPPVFPLRP